jgi:hypothetical protein
LLNKDRIGSLRAEMLEAMSRYHLLDPAYPQEVGMSDVEAVNRLSAADFGGMGVPIDLYREVQKLESFHAIAHEPALLHAFRVLFGEEVFPHPRNIARIVIPHRELKATPSHQDFIHIQGTPQTWTAWFPLGDCPRSLGGLAMLEGSHKHGVFGVTHMEGGAGGLEAILCGLDYEWAEGDYEAGDVIVFHSQTVHKALPNQNGRAVRLSCDFRYQPIAQPIDSSSLQPHGGEQFATWEQLYEGWKNEDLKYYWQRTPVELSEWDESIRWQKEKIC